MRVLVIAPHPDDETLGCGGALLRHREAGDVVTWCIATAMTAEGGYTPERMAARATEIRAVAAAYRCADVVTFGYPTTTLDIVPMGELVTRFRDVVARATPDIVYLPHRGDAHSDHHMTVDAAWSACKTFRAPSVHRVLAYEVPSETDFAYPMPADSFVPNVFMDITGRVEEKICTMGHYVGELGPHPFPRSAEHIRARAIVRGAAAGVTHAEAFVLLRECV